MSVEISESSKPYENCQQIIARLDAHEPERRSGTLPALYLFSVDRPRMLQRKFDISPANSTILLKHFLNDYVWDTDVIGQITANVAASILPDCDDEMEIPFGERFCRGIKESSIQFFECDLNFRVSIGIAVQIKGGNAREWIWRAGSALREAQRRGGNCYITNRNQLPWTLTRKSLHHHSLLIPPNFLFYL